MLEDVGLDLCVDLAAIGVVLGAGLSADGEALRNRHTGGSHLRQAGALAAQNVLHGGQVAIEGLAALIEVVKVLFAHCVTSNRN